MTIWQRLVKHLDVLAIVIASITAIVLHHLGIIPEVYVVSLILFLLAVHALEDAVRGEEIRGEVKEIGQVIKVPELDMELIKPSDLLHRAHEFSLRNRGEEWWFNACASMFRSQALFDQILKPSIESPKTRKIIFILQSSMKDIWEKDVWPKIEKCRGREKVQPPVWGEMEESIAFQMIDVGVEREEKEAFLTVWGEPFMMEHVGRAEKTRMPRHVLYLKSNSELIPHLKDIFTRYRLEG